MKTVLLYAAILFVFVFGIDLIIQSGSRIEIGKTSPEPGSLTVVPAHPVRPKSGTETAHSVFDSLVNNSSEPLSRLLLQIVIIIVVARVAGLICSRIGQPAVVGEMIAGILLGPSLFGWLAPGAFSFVFAPASLSTLGLISQIGVCLFMFVVGMELDQEHLRRRAKTALFVSQVSIVFPFFLGVLLSLWLYTPLAAPGASFTSFALFLGIATSITAFPVLARILDERGISKTSLGSTAISCAAVGDVTAWSILAFIVVLTRAGSIVSILVDLVLLIGFVAFMLLIVRALLSRWFSIGENDEKLTKSTMAGVLLVFLASALTTEILGIHALFGAFLAGVIMPSKTAFRHALKLRLENFSSILLLPLFFAFIGLRTQIGLLEGISGWGICLLIIFVATLGKLGGGMVTARLTGVTWLDSFRLGALMNTRGLMELIALNLGYDLGILSPAIFAMLVIMGLTTTVFTVPLLNLANAIEHRAGLESFRSRTA